MARNSKAYKFDDFESVDGSYNLFENAIRNAMEYDNKRSDLFDAVLLTDPQPVTRDPSGNLVPAATKSNNYACMVRIMGQDSPHRFLADPCELHTNTTVEDRRRAFNLIQQHTKVFLTEAQNDSLVAGEIISIRLERGSYGTFKTSEAKEFVEIVTRKGSLGDITGVTPIDTACGTLISAFGATDLMSLGALAGDRPTPKVMTHIESGFIIENGRIPEDLLVAIPSLYPNVPTTDDSGRPIKFVAELIEPFVELAQAYHKEFGEEISVSDSYRSYDRQVSMKANPRYSNYAATPGTSNHGWGVAFDVNGTKVTHPGGPFVSDNDNDGKINAYSDRIDDSKVYLWLVGYCSSPSVPFLNDPGLKEAWHWEAVSVRKRIYEESVASSTPESNDHGEAAPEGDE